MKSNNRLSVMGLIGLSIAMASVVPCGWTQVASSGGVGGITSSQHARPKHRTRHTKRKRHKTYTHRSHSYSSPSGPSIGYALSESDLRGRTNWDLDIMRNTIFARYGRTFVRRDLQSYFDQQSWYHRDSGFRESWLSSLEKRNAAFIGSYQHGRR